LIDRALQKSDIKQGYARDGKLTPKEKGIAFATAWKAHNAGRVEEQNMAEAAQGHTIEAHGVRGMDRRTWHKTFRNTDQMIAWAEKHDAEIMGTRDLEQARHHNLSPAEQDMAEGVVDTVKKIGKKLIKPVEVPGLNQMKAIHNAELKRELAAQNKKYAPKDVKEGSGDVVQVHQHQHGKDMGKYGAFNIERETPTVIVVYDHNTGEMLKFSCD
jgi:hypothetical protein